MQIVMTAARLLLGGRRGTLKDIVFVHVPKTAGSSLRRGIAWSRHGTEILLDYGPNAERTSAAIKEAARQGGGGAAASSRIRAKLAPGRPITLMGHFPARRYSTIAAPCSFVTFLRSPVDRVISEYVHARKHNGLSETIHAFADRRRDVQSKHLSGVPLEQWGFIGTTENYDEDLKRLSRFTGLPILSWRLNRGKYDPASAELKRDPELRRYIEARNEQDIELYRRVLAERDHFTRAKQREARPARIHAVATLLPGGEIEGYAVDRGTGTPPELRILKNGRVVGRVMADLYRQDLVGRHAAHGVGGFHVDPRAYRASADELTIEIGGRPVPVERQQAPADAV